MGAWHLCHITAELPGEPEVWGTSDVVVLDHASRAAAIVDLKFGLGVLVEADTPQLAAYGTLAAAKCGLSYRGLDTWIVQPRAEHSDGIARRHQYTADELAAFEQKMRISAAATRQADAPRHAGLHCQFCAARGGCETRRRHEMAGFGVDIDPTQVEPNDCVNSLHQTLDTSAAATLLAKPNGGPIDAVDATPRVCAKAGPTQTVIEGDCLVALRDVPTECIDVVVTSPPYNIGVVYGRHNDRMPRADYLAWLPEVFVELRRVLRGDGSFFLNISGHGVTNDLTLPHAIEGAAYAAGWLPQNRIVWVKAIAIEGCPVRGHDKPVNSSRYLTRQHELILHLSKCDDVVMDKLAVGVPYADKSNLARHNKSQADSSTPKPDIRERGNVWFIDYPTVQSKADKHNHEAGFPVALPMLCIKLHGMKPGMVVLDPFCRNWDDIGGGPGAERGGRRHRDRPGLYRDCTAPIGWRLAGI